MLISKPIFKLMLIWIRNDKSKKLFIARNSGDKNYENIKQNLKETDRVFKSTKTIYTVSVSHLLLYSVLPNLVLISVNVLEETILIFII